MAQIRGLEGISEAVVARELTSGARFVRYQYVVSALVVTFYRTSPVYYLRPGESRTAKGLPWSILTLCLGWWGFPWGFIRTPVALYKNFTGGVDVTREVTASLWPNGTAAAVQAVPAAPVAPTAPAGPSDVVLAKRTFQQPDRTVCLVTFQQPGGAPVELEVPADWFAYLNQGDQGSLKLQNGYFGGFDKAS